MSTLAHFIADWMNYALALLLLIDILCRPDRRKWTFLPASIAAIAVSVGLAEIGKHVLLYPHYGGFPSGHESFAVSTLTCLVWRDRRWLWIAVPAAIILAAALVIAHYHRPIDVVGAVVISPLTTSAVLGICRRFFGKPANIPA